MIAPAGFFRFSVRRHGSTSYRLFAWVLLATLTACAPGSVTREIRQTHQVSSMQEDGRFLKAHMKDGTVFVLYQWLLDADSLHLHGQGRWLDVHRQPIRTADHNMGLNSAIHHRIALDQVALLETNDPGNSIGAGLGFVSGLTGLMALHCLLNPKACFGSCPTFYAFDGDTMAIQAESFSSSIAPSLEAKDIDMLYTAIPADTFVMRVTNEALETHSIRYARLLAFPRLPDERVFVTRHEAYYRCTDMRPPRSCSSAEGDCTAAVREVDRAEYFSLADGRDLSTREELLLSFDADMPATYGLVLGKRQSLMTTFLMYQGLAYMGRSVAHWLAEMERGKPVPAEHVFSLLGGIEVFLRDSTGAWTLVDRIQETGPIATDYTLVPLRAHAAGPLDIKLRMTKGLWRLNYLALARMGETVVPDTVYPSTVDMVAGSDPHPLRSLLDTNRHLVTYPGDEYTLTFQLPYPDAELFLDAKGYYLEWTRESWEQEQNFRKLYQYIYHPARFLRRIAPAYKRHEPEMEATFWSSRYVR